MRVVDVHTPQPRACSPDASLAHAAVIMWNHDCGVVPVVEFGRVVGMITDRDVCLAVGMRSRRATDIAVREIMSRAVHSCRPGDDLAAALRTMARYKVRRLAVTDERGQLRGVLSINDILRRVDEPGGPGRDLVLDTIQEISRPAASAEVRHAG